MKKLDKLRTSRKNLEVKKEEIVVPKIQNEIKSKIDYSKYNLNETDTELLIEKEYILTHSIEEIKKNFANQAKTLYEAQKIFTGDNAESNFNEWFTMLGFKKTYVYQVINIYKLYLNYNVERIFELPKELTYKLSQQDDFKKEEIIEILKDEKPNEKLKELNKIKEEQNKPKEVIDISSFIELDKKEQKKELKNITLSRKNRIEQLAKKKDDLKELKEEIENLKKEIKKIKEIEEQMKLEIQKND